jgi:hypothetical protein
MISCALNIYGRALIKIQPKKQPANNNIGDKLMKNIVYLG